MYAEWTHYKHTHIHFDCSYFGTLGKLGKADIACRLKVDIYGTQHFGSEVFKRRGAHKLPGGNKNVAWVLSRSELNPRLIVKLSKSHCTFGK